MKLATPIGDFWLTANPDGLTESSFAPIAIKNEDLDNCHLQQAARQLAEYFAGQRQNFSVPLAVQTGTTFQQEVWQALQQIPYGQTRSYLDIAQQIQRPQAVRAIGQANRSNPLALFIPCHRVIGKNGKLTGYMGTDGLVFKEQLLQLEQGKISLF